MKFFVYIILFMLLFVIVPDITFAKGKNPRGVVSELLETISVIKDESTTKLTPEERKNNKKFKQIANSLIDIPSLGPKTLGTHWKKRTRKEKDEFISILTELFGKVAYPKSAKFFVDLKIKYKNEVIKKDKAKVSTSMEHESEGLIGIDYKLRKVNKKWLIYDVILDDVSLVTNLRTKFHEVVRKYSFEELIGKMSRRLKKEK